MSRHYPDPVSHGWRQGDVSVLILWTLLLCFANVANRSENAGSLTSRDLLSRYAIDPARPIRIVGGSHTAEPCGTSARTVDKQVASKVFGAVTVQNNLKLGRQPVFDFWATTSNSDSIRVWVANETRREVPNKFQDSHARRSGGAIRVRETPLLPNTVLLRDGKPTWDR